MGMRRALMLSPDPALIAEYVAPPSAAYVRQYLRANLFDDDEGGVLTVKIAEHLDVLVELVLDLFSEIWEDDGYTLIRSDSWRLRSDFDVAPRPRSPGQDLGDGGVGESASVGDGPQC